MILKISEKLSFVESGDDLIKSYKLHYWRDSHKVIEILVRLVSKSFLGIEIAVFVLSHLGFSERNNNNLGPRGISLYIHNRGKGHHTFSLAHNGII